MAFQPSGQERTVTLQSSLAIDGASVAHIIVLAAIVTTLAAIPLSVVIGSGKSFPMSQAIYPLVGWLLGPIAGALATGIGALAGVFLFPHTTTIWWATVLGAVFGGFTAGTLHPTRRRWSWLIGGTLAVLAYIAYAGRAVWQNGVAPLAVLAGSFIDWSALLLYLLPTRTLAGRWIGDSRPARLALGLALGTWMIAGLVHLFTAVWVYLIFNWPAAVWQAIAPMAPLEHALRTFVGAAIGTGVISGLRRLGLPRPEHALY